MDNIVFDCEHKECKLPPVYKSRKVNRYKCVYHKHNTYAKLPDFCDYELCIVRTDSIRCEFHKSIMEHFKAPNKNNQKKCSYCTNLAEYKIFYKYACRSHYIECLKYMKQYYNTRPYISKDSKIKDKCVICLDKPNFVKILSNQLYFYCYNCYFKNTTFCEIGTFVDYVKEVIENESIEPEIVPKKQKTEPIALTNECNYQKCRASKLFNGSFCAEHLEFESGNYEWINNLFE